MSGPKGELFATAQPAGFDSRATQSNLAAVAARQGWPSRRCTRDRPPSINIPMSIQSDIVTLHIPRNQAAPLPFWCDINEITRRLNARHIPGDAAATTVRKAMEEWQGGLNWRQIASMAADCAAWAYTRGEASGLRGCQ